MRLPASRLRREACGLRLGLGLLRLGQRRDRQVGGGIRLRLVDRRHHLVRRHAQHRREGRGQFGHLERAGLVVVPERIGAARRHGAERGQPVVVAEAVLALAGFQGAHAGHQVARQAPVFGRGAAQRFEREPEHLVRRHSFEPDAGLELHPAPALGHVEGHHHAPQRMQDRADHGFFRVARGGARRHLLRHHPGQHGLFHLDVGQRGIGRALREFLDQFQAQREVADRLGAEHQHRLRDGVDALAEGRVHAAVGQAQHLLRQDRVRQHGLRHREFALVLAAHRGQDGVDGAREAGHVALAPDAFPQQGEGGVGRWRGWK